VKIRLEGVCRKFGGFGLLSMQCRSVVAVLNMFRLQQQLTAVEKETNGS